MISSRSDTVQVLVPDVERWLDGALPLAKTLMNPMEHLTWQCVAPAHFIAQFTWDWVHSVYILCTTQVHDGRSSTVAIWTRGCDFPDCSLAAKCDESTVVIRVDTNR